MTQILVETRLRIFNSEGFVKILDSSKLLKIVLRGILICVYVKKSVLHMLYFSNSCLTGENRKVLSMAFKMWNTSNGQR